MGTWCTDSRLEYKPLRHKCKTCQREGQYLLISRYVWSLIIHLSFSSSTFPPLNSLHPCLLQCNKCQDRPLQCIPQQIKYSQRNNWQLWKRQVLIINAINLPSMLCYDLALGIVLGYDYRAMDQAYMLCSERLHGKLWL